MVLHEGEKKVGEFSSEAPIPEGVLLKCEGRCAAELGGIYLVAEDQSLFLVNRTLTPGGEEIVVEKGVIFFALSSLPRSLRIITPEVAFSAEEVMVHASGSGMLKGYVSITEESSELGVIDGGSIVISTAEGRKRIQAGERMVVARAVSGDASGGSGIGSGGKGTGVIPVAGILAGSIAAEGSFVLLMRSDKNKEASPFEPHP